MILNEELLKGSFPRDIIYYSYYFSFGFQNLKKFAFSKQNAKFVKEMFQIDFFYKFKDFHYEIHCLDPSMFFFLSRFA